MATQIFKNYEEFKQREDKTVNGVSPEFAEKHQNWADMNETNLGCYNCYNCSYCTNCYICYACSTCHNCDDCDNCRDCNVCSNCYNCDCCYRCKNCEDCSDFNNTKGRECKETDKNRWVVRGIELGRREERKRLQEELRNILGLDEV